MASSSSTELLAIHGLRLKGFTGPDTIAALYGLSEDDTIAALTAAAAAGFVLLREGRRSGWTMTANGRVENERLLKEELDATGGRDDVQIAYEAFLALNGRMLQVCTDWQVKGENELNDHEDAAYDAGVIDELAAIDALVQPICASLGSVLDRFAIHAPRFTSSLTKVRAGEREWFTKPIMESYHTVWFEMHEDLLASLGIDRASEKAH